MRLEPFDIFTICFLIVSLSLIWCIIICAIKVEMYEREVERDENLHIARTVSPRVVLRIWQHGALPARPSGRLGDVGESGISTPDLPLGTHV